MGTRGRHRVPTLYRPDRTYRDGCILLGLVSGIAASAINEAHLQGDDVAIGIFSVFFAADLWLYFTTAWHWINTWE